jgi:hypothetical protein
MYRSGIFSFAAPFSKSNTPGIDLSDSSGTLYDILIAGYRGSSIVIHAPYGFYEPGAVDVPNSGKAGMDTLVSCMRVTAPENGFECCSSATVINQDTRTMLVVRTSEGHYGLFVLYDWWPGGYDHYQCYWGYQSDGSRRFNPDVECSKTPRTVPRPNPEAPRMQAIFSNNAITIALPGEHCSGTILIYDIRGRLIKKHFVAGSLRQRLDLSMEPAGSYVLKIAAGNREHVYRFVKSP